MRVIPVPALKDNYAYLVVDGKTAAVIDPSEAPPVRAALEREGLTLGAIWLTHHHLDHVGGVEELAGDLEVVGSAHDLAQHRIPKQTRAVREGDTVELGKLRFSILDVPGHTLGAIAFFGEGAVFTGDTLFLGGCGRVFEGTMEMMHASLEKLRALPESTRVYCGHEYTLSNLKFAHHVEPKNPRVAESLEEAKVREMTVPGTIGIERGTNPFFRTRELAEGRDLVTTFTALREAKNNF